MRLYIALLPTDRYGQPLGVTGTVKVMSLDIGYYFSLNYYNLVVCICCYKYHQYFHYTVLSMIMPSLDLPYIN